MRIISNEELLMVSGGSLAQDIYNRLMQWIDGKPGAEFQSIEITAQRMTDLEKLQYDQAELAAAFPNCTVSFDINPSQRASTVGVEAGTSGAKGTASSTYTAGSIKFNMSCPALGKPVPNQP